MHIRNRSFLALLALGAASGCSLSAQAGELPLAELGDPVRADLSLGSGAVGERESVLDSIWNAATLYKNDDAAVLNELRFAGRLHLDYFDLLGSDGSDDRDLLVRRWRLGGEARLFRNLVAEVEVDLDPESDGSLYGGFTDFNLAWKFSDAAELTVGKQSVKFTLDGSTSSNSLYTIERSNVANNFWFTAEYVPGIGLNGDVGDWTYNTGVFSGGREDKEFGDFKGGFFWLGSVGRDFGESLGVESALLRLDYVYNDPNPDSTFTRSFEHIGSLVYEVDAGRMGVSGDFTATDGFLGQSDAFGGTILPWFDLTERLQVATRYTYIESDDPNGVRLTRYERVAASGRGDRYQEFYAGLNYFIYGNRFKLQTGLTYADMRDRANDGGAYDGWTWATALRISW